MILIVASLLRKFITGGSSSGRHSKKILIFLSWLHSYYIFHHLLLLVCKSWYRWCLHAPPLDIRYRCGLQLWQTWWVVIVLVVVVPGSSSSSRLWWWWSSGKSQNNRLAQKMRRIRLISYAQSSIISTYRAFFVMIIFLFKCEVGLRERWSPLCNFTSYPSLV